jgi:hypothetical protein
MKFDVRAIAMVVALSAGFVPAVGGVAIAQSGPAVVMSAEFGSVVRAAATNPSLETALAQIDVLIADNPALAEEIAVLAAALRPEISLSIARSAATARPDKAAQIFAAVDAAAPGRDVLAGLKDFEQASSRPMNFGAGPQGAAPQSSRGYNTRPDPGNTVPRGPVSGP